ncbi:MAG TPA: hypothetical protein VJ327_09690, partial [Patescibacteria group bacterium]|nr:hypothetical protein [Patescibacteria group bacterium]
CSLFHGNLLPEYITMKCNLKRVLPFPKRRSKIQNVVVMQNVVVVLINHLFLRVRPHDSNKLR